MHDPDDICQKYFMKPGLRTLQRPIVDSVIRGDHIIGILATGGGKTLTYQVPYLLSSGITIVVSPLVALINDQVSGLPAALLPSTVVLSGDSCALIRIIQESLQAHGRCLVYTSPEKLANFINCGFSTENVTRLVLDEAHCISEWGNTFREAYLKLPLIWKQLGNPPIQAMTATASPGTLNDLTSLFPVEFKVIRSSVYRPNLHLSIIEHQATENRDSHLLSLIRHRTGPVIIYANSRTYVDRTSGWLIELGFIAEGFHAGMPPEVRSEIQNRFVSGKTDILVATIAFGMGIDKPDIRHVFHIEPPSTLEDYQQQVGRAGRDGAQAWCVAFDTLNKRRHRVETLRIQLRNCKRSDEQSFDQRLLIRKQEMERFLAKPTCRHRYLMSYSGEADVNRHCGHCDNCR